MRKSEMIRDAVIGDAAQIAEVNLASWQAIYRGHFADEFLDSLDVDKRTVWLEQQMERGLQIIVSEAGGRVVGYTFIGPSDSEGWGEIFAIYVHPDAWLQGHGYALFNAAVDRLAQQGFERLLLWVLRENDQARSFYERQGMTLGKPVRIEEIGGSQVTELRYELVLGEHS